MNITNFSVREKIEIQTFNNINKMNFKKVYIFFFPIDFYLFSRILQTDYQGAMKIE